MSNSCIDCVCSIPVHNVSASTAVEHQFREYWSMCTRSGLAGGICISSKCFSTIMSRSIKTSWTVLWCGRLARLIAVAG